MVDALRWLHVVTAAAWVGGMVCFVALMMPWVREADSAQRHLQMKQFGRRFRRYAWACFAVSGVSGVVMVAAHWGAWPTLDTGAGRLLSTKVILLGAAMALNACDSRNVPRAVSRWAGRASLVLGLALVWFAIQLAHA